MLDTFRGHFYNKVKAHNANHPLLKWIMMDGGITPKAQPLDILINNFFKGFFNNLFKEWSLNAPTNPNTGHPLAPSCQLFVQCIVKAWAKVPKELVWKSWEVYGYKSTEDLSNEEETTSVAVINYSQEQLGTMIENIAGDDARMVWIDEANDRQPIFPKEENDVSWDVGTVVRKSWEFC